METWHNKVISLPANIVLILTTELAEFERAAAAHHPDVKFYIVTDPVVRMAVILTIVSYYRFLGAAKHCSNDLMLFTFISTNHEVYAR